MYCVSQCIGSTGGVNRYLVLEHREEFGLIPVFAGASGFSMIRETDQTSEFYAFNGKRFPVLSRQAYLEYLKINFPTTYEFEIERDSDALTSAFL